MGKMLSIKAINNTYNSFFIKYKFKRAYEEFDETGEEPK